MVGVKEFEECGHHLLQGDDALSFPGETGENYEKPVGIADIKTIYIPNICPEHYGCTNWLDDRIYY
jgi:hypothetical protein